MDTINTDDLITTVLAEGNDSLSKLLGADVFMLKAPMVQPIDDIVRTEIEGIKEKKGRSKNKLVFLIETTGGYAESVERIVSVVRTHYEEAEFIVPNYAYSAGTLLVLSGDKIYMDYYSVLGPIDPQFQGENGDYVPGMGYLAKFQELIETINRVPTGDEDKIRAELALITKKFDPAKLFHIEQSVAHAKTLLTNWLPKYKFKRWLETSTRKIPVTDEMRRRRAEEIADILGDTKRWHVHGRGISIAELTSEEIKLKVENFGDNPRLNKAVRHYHGLFIDYLGRRGIKAAAHSSRGLRRII